MSVFIIRRLLQSLLVVVIMSFLVFMAIYQIGDPTDLLVSPDAPQEEIERVKRDFGVDLPFHEQYLKFVGKALQGDLGNSFVMNDPALQLILQKMPATLELAFSALFLSIVLGIPLGVYAGLRHGTFSSKLIMSGSILGFSLPTFWVGLMMIMIFAVYLGWLPSTGRGETVEVLGIEVSFLTWDGLTHLFMPALNLALLKISLVIRLARAGVRETIHMDYIKFARAKGLSYRRVILLHLMKNIMIPIVTVIGLEFGGLIAFSVITETIFAWPGMGKLIIESILLLDRPMVVAYLMITVMMFIIINLLVDILYSILDPRVRLQDVKS
ncbi:ABC transporter permease subunit [Alphaproteobacteria bacterium HT1-32]|nr:ABC transporter permease subunit [Alphaproteobacteria bacterium HT1-32]